MGVLPLTTALPLLTHTALLHTSHYLYFLCSPLSAGVGREWGGTTRASS
jgi:hypothetical protein